LRRYTKEFRAIATSSGSNSVDKKKGLIKKLLVGARECEAGYLVRRCKLTGLEARV
jgi:DNA ligase-1